MEGPANFEGALNQRMACRGEKGKKDGKPEVSAQERDKERLVQTFGHDTLTPRFVLNRRYHLSVSLWT